MGEAKYIYFTCLKCKATSSWHKPDQQWRLRPCAFRFSDGSFCFRHSWSFCSPLRLALSPSSTLGTLGTLGNLGSPNLVSRRRKSRPILLPPRVAVTAAPLHLPYLVVRTLVDMVVRTLVDMVVRTLVDMVVPTLVDMVVLTLAPLTALTALTALTVLTALTALIALTALTLVVLTLVAITLAVFDINVTRRSWTTSLEPTLRVSRFHPTLPLKSPLPPLTLLPLTLLKAKLKRISFPCFSTSP